MGYLRKHHKTHVNVDHVLMFVQKTSRYVYDKYKNATQKTHIRRYKTTDTFELKPKTSLFQTCSCLIRRMRFTIIVLLRNKYTYMLLLSRYLFDKNKTLTKTKHIRRYKITHTFEFIQKAHHFIHTCGFLHIYVEK